LNASLVSPEAIVAALQQDLGGTPRHADDDVLMSAVLRDQRD
jgi:hypothetical protein